VLFVDAASYAVSVGVLLRLAHVPQPAPGASPSLLGELRDGWQEFRSRTWLVATTVQFCLFNALVWAPYLVLGPVVADRRLGGAGAWGLVLAANSAGSILGAVALLGRQPRRPLVLAVVMTFGYALTPALLASSLPLPWVCAAAAGTGAAAAAAGALENTVMQRRVPFEVLGRITAYQTVGAFALGPIGLAVAGPLASVFGLTAFLAFGAVFQVVSNLAVLAVPAIWRFDLEDPDLSEASATVIETVIEAPDEAADEARADARLEHTAEEVTDQVRTTAPSGG
jgi:hypothetical protein